MKKVKLFNKYYLVDVDRLIFIITMFILIVVVALGFVKLSNMEYSDVLYLKQ